MTDRSLPTPPPIGWSRTLLLTAAISAALLLLALVGLVVDDRLITGAPAWLKPAKFGASGAIYILTMAWMIRAMPATRLLRFATATIGWLLVLETIVIAVQAARGTMSHFNIDTPLDIAIFSSMGTAIAVVWVMSAVVLLLHLRTPHTDRALAMAFRLGLAINIAGAGVGWTMTQPRPAQMEAIRRGERPRISGSHTVGAPDGGAGLPITQWSRDHGDLRIPHFVGMHAWQLLPLLLLGLRRMRRQRDDGTERNTVVFVAAACAALFVGALLQAMAGHPLLASFATGP
jgi:hypothetical protein